MVKTWSIFAAVPDDHTVWYSQIIWTLGPFPQSLFFNHFFSMNIDQLQKWSLEPVLKLFIWQVCVTFEHKTFWSKRTFLISSNNEHWIPRDWSKHLMLFSSTYKQCKSVRINPNFSLFLILCNFLNITFLIIHTFFQVSKQVNVYNCNYNIITYKHDTIMIFVPKIFIKHRKYSQLSEATQPFQATW